MELQSDSKLPNTINFTKTSIISEQGYFLLVSSSDFPSHIHCSHTARVVLKIDSPIMLCILCTATCQWIPFFIIECGMPGLCSSLTAFLVVLYLQSQLCILVKNIYFHRLISNKPGTIVLILILILIQCVVVIFCCMIILLDGVYVIGVILLVLVHF